MFGQLEIGEEKGTGIPSAINSMQNMCLKGRFTNASGNAIKDRKVFGNQHSSCDWQWYAAFWKLVTRLNSGQVGLDIATANKAGNWFGHSIIRWTFDKLRHISNFNFTSPGDRFSPDTWISIVWFVSVFWDACEIRKCQSVLKKSCFLKQLLKRFKMRSTSSIFKFSKGEKGH